MWMTTSLKHISFSQTIYMCQWQCLSEEISTHLHCLLCFPVVLLALGRTMQSVQQTKHLCKSDSDFQQYWFRGIILLWKTYESKHEHLHFLPWPTLPYIFCKKGSCGSNLFVLIFVLTLQLRSNWLIQEVSRTRETNR